jgi:hypothetical protein
LAAEAALAAGLADAVRLDRRAFLHSGAPWCGWCGKLEAWMAQEDVRTILAKEFVDLKIDVDRTVDGKETLQRFRGDEQQGIPWFAILDGAGKVLARGDMASGGPIGFPYEEAEIETFAAMLAESATRLTPDDLGALKRSLAAVRERDERAKAERKAKEVPPEETKDTDDAETTEEQDG